MTRQNGQTVEMRPWLLGALVVVLGAVGFVITRDEERCFPSSTVHDGNVLADGPQSADEALVGFLSVGPHMDTNGDTMPSDLASYKRVEVSGERVTYEAGQLRLFASRQPNGWAIGNADIVC